MQSASQSDRTTAQGRSLLPSAIGIGLVIFYVLFTLLPNSNSLMVKWPWVFIWQFGLMLGPVALLFQLWHRSFRRLGNGLDWIAGAWCLVLVLSAAFAEFSHQAFWYSWVAICGIAFLYALNSWITSAKRVQALLSFQGCLNVIFSGISLIAWLLQTVLPHLETLEKLKSYGIETSFDLQSIPLRNWHPLGHQNYVAGYLTLALPLLIGLAFSQRGWRRVGWLCGFSLSLVTLYSTASRAGWLSLIVSVAVFISLSAWQYPKLRKILLATSFVSFATISLWGFSSDRIRGLFTALFNQGSEGETTYRAITNTTGWFMGLDHPILGAGLGSVTLLYQKYRPSWAGRDAELTYQLHSTPAQLWAELGSAGAFLTIASIIVIIYLSLRCCKAQKQMATQAITPLPLLIGISSSFAGYSIYAITDYQLDNICISGTLIIFFAVLIFENRQISATNEPAGEISSATSRPIHKRLALAGTSLMVAVSIWLYPIHRAWMLSSQGFLALQQDDIASFVTYLDSAHRLAPWEPYYPYQLAWNLGEMAFQSTDSQQQESLRQESVQWFEKAIAYSPNREFGYSNLGWLLVNSDPTKATHNFLQAAQLVPQKKGSFFALGYSLQKEGKTDLARQSMVTELIQHPSLLTSAIWQSPELLSLYPQVLTDFESEISKQLEAEASEDSAFYWHYTLGSLYWWQGNFNKARMAFDQARTPLSQMLMILTEESPRASADLITVEENSLPRHLLSWQSLADTTSNDSYLMLVKAMLHDQNLAVMPPLEYINDTVSNIQESVVSSSSFYDWLTQKAPIRQRRNQRLGFGTISRHIDGPIPSDFSLRIENIIVEDLLGATLFRSRPPDMSTDTSFSTHQQDLYRQIADSVSETSS